MVYREIIVVCSEKDRKCKHNLMLRSVRITIICRGKAISITYSKCVSVALVMQHETRMRRII